MRYFSYGEPAEHGGDIVHTFSEEVILNDYWPFWEMAMIKKYGLGHHLITKENCLEDWAIANWAWEVPCPE